MATTDPREPFTRITVAEAKDKLDKGEAVMVDVREPNEYAEVHAEGVRLIPDASRPWSRLGSPGGRGSHAGPFS